MLLNFSSLFVPVSYGFVAMSGGESKAHEKSEKLTCSNCFKQSSWEINELGED